MHLTFGLIWAAQAMWFLGLFGEAIRRGEPVTAMIMLWACLLLAAGSGGFLHEARKP